MTGSDANEDMAAKRDRNEARRLEAIDRWVRHIEETPPEQWGTEQNALVNAQVEAARQADLDAEHYQEVERIARELAERDQ